MLAQPGARGRGDGATLSERALVLVANRLASPGSEHALAQWLENDFICDRHGRRWVAAWRDDTERKASRSPRVRVAARQLQQWYRTLDQLLERKAQIEHALYLTLRDLFSLRVDMVFYDLTSTYFEGKGRPGLVPMATAAMASRATGKCWWGWFWSTVGRSLIMCSRATGAMPRPSPMS